MNSTTNAKKLHDNLHNNTDSLINKMDELSSTASVNHYTNTKKYYNP
jgi:hypothetical protein